MKKMKLDLQFFASKTITGSEVTGNYSWAKIQGRVICEETYVGTSNENKSTIKCTVQARVTTGGTTAANWRCGVTLNGVTQTGKLSSNTKFTDSWQTIKTFTFENVAHNEDGTKKITISGYAQAPEYPTSLGDAKSSFSGEMELTTIPRASTLDSFGGSKRIGVNNDVIINFTKKSSGFTTTLIYATKSDFSDAETIVDKSTNASTYSWTLPIELLNKIPNSKTLTIYVMLATFDGDTQIGTAQVDSFTANVYEDNCRPVWNTHTIEETDTTAKQLVTTANKFIANLSKPKFTFSATGQYGATISYYQINNVTRSSGFTDSNFNTNGYVLKVVDSRGITNTYTFPITYVPYFTPVFEEVKLLRDVPTSNKVFSFFRIKFFNNTSSVKFDNPQALSYKINYQENGATAQEKIITPETYDDGTSRYAENETELGDTFNYKKSVDWTFFFVDLTGRTFATSNTLPMGIPLMNGKTEEDGEQALYINGDIKGEGANHILTISSDEPENKIGVWFQNTNKIIYVKNSNDGYDVFYKDSDMAKKTQIDSINTNVNTLTTKVNTLSSKVDTLSAVKSYITCAGTSDITNTATGGAFTAATIIPLTEVSKRGDLFTISNNRIYFNRDCVANVSAQVYITSKITSGDLIRIMVIRNETSDYLLHSTTRMQGTYESLSSPTKAISFSAGDFIDLRFNNGNRTGTVCNAQYTFISVLEV